MIFEEEVALALRNAGYEVDVKVGSVEYSLDLAVIDPRNPGSYIMGMHCDGLEYNRPVTARDRDRLRREVLERLGWKFHYLWSAEWFANPAKELKRARRRRCAASRRCATARCRWRGRSCARRWWR